MVRAREAILAAWRRGARQRVHAHCAGDVRPAAVARRAVHSSRDHAAAAVVPVPSRQGLVLVAHRDGAAVHALHAQAARQQSARGAHPRAVHAAARARAPLLSPPRWPRGPAGALFLLLDRIAPQDRPADPARTACARHAARRGLDSRAPQRRGRTGRDLSGDGQRARSARGARLSARRSAARAPPSARSRSCWSSRLARPTASRASRRCGTRRWRRWRCRTRAGEAPLAAAQRGLEWLRQLQLLDEPGDWRIQPPAPRRRRLGVPIRQQLLPRPRRHGGSRLGNDAGERLRRATRPPSTVRSTGWPACKAATAASRPSMSTTPATTSTRSRSPIMARCSIRRPATSRRGW